MGSKSGVRKDARERGFGYGRLSSEESSSPNLRLRVRHVLVQEEVAR